MEPYDFGNTLRKYRKKKQLTQQQLADKLEVTFGNVSKYEANLSYPTFEKLRALSAVLGISLDELCGTQKKETISVYNLTNEQKQIIAELIDTFRNYNEGTSKKNSPRQYELIGRITDELLRR